jgi:hypothetical protein
MLSGIRSVMAGHSGSCAGAEGGVNWKEKVQCRFPAHV